MVIWSCILKFTLVRSLSPVLIVIGGSHCMVKSRLSVMIVTRRSNDVMARFTLHGPGKTVRLFWLQDCKIARKWQMAFSMPSCFVYLYGHCSFLVININTTAIDSPWIAYFRTSRSFRAPPCCDIGRFISRRVSVADKAGSFRHVSFAGSHGPAKPAFCRYRRGKLVNHIILI